jgi:translation elongation factor P/translation initiation factor 5A
VDFSLADNELKLNLICRMNKNAKVVTVRNKILTDIYRDQTNFVILNYGSFEEGVKLTPEKSEYSFVVKK